MGFRHTFAVLYQTESTLLDFPRVKFYKFGVNQPPCLLSNMVTQNKFRNSLYRVVCDFTTLVMDFVSLNQSQFLKLLNLSENE